jgi:membrane protein DedA with SNARE-associated domain
MHSPVGLLHAFLNQILSGQTPHPGVWAYFLLALLGLSQGYLIAALGAVASADGLLDPWMVFLSISLGHLAADNVWFFLGRFWGVELLARYGSRIGAGRGHMEAFSQGGSPSIGRLVFLSKLTSGVTIPMLVVAGASRLPWARAFGAMAAGEALRTGIIVFVGYHFALSTERLGTWLQVIALLGSLAVLWLSLRYLRGRMNSTPRRRE